MKIMKILIIAEHQHHTLAASTLGCITAALKLGTDITVLVAGKSCNNAVKEAASCSDVSTVLQIDDDRYAYFLAENMAMLIASLAKDYTHILMPATTFGKNILPRAAALLDITMISDIIAIKDTDTFVRPIYAGNALATIKSHEAIKCLSIRPTAFSKAGIQSDKATIMATIKTLPVTLPVFENTVFIKQTETVSKRPSLGQANCVVSFGRGLQSKANLPLIEKLADCLHAAIGASRAAVDAGFIANEYQVGQTGKVVAPALYIAIGISGAIQHVAGMKDSKVIVAINNDARAPIFEIADYGLLEDMFTAIPKLIEALSALS